jgi:hypothetical protein
MRTPASLRCATAVAVAATGLSALPSAIAAPPTKEVTSGRFVELDPTVAFAVCDGFTVANEFTVSATEITFEDRQIRHVRYTGRLYRVDRREGAPVVGRSLRYEGRFTRTAEWSAGGGPDDFTSLKLTGRRATLFLDDGRRVQLGAGLVSIDPSADPPVKVAGIDEPERICDALA